MLLSYSKWADYMQAEAKQALKLEDLPEGRAVHTEAGGKSICLLRRGNSVFAFKDICPHIGGRLSDGVVSSKNHVVCPVHSASFDVATGASLSFSRRGLTIYDVSIDNGFISIGAEHDIVWREKLPDPRDELWGD